MKWPKSTDCYILAIFRVDQEPLYCPLVGSAAGHTNFKNDSPLIDVTSPSDDTNSRRRDI